MIETSLYPNVVEYEVELSETISGGNFPYDVSVEDENMILVRV